MNRILATILILQCQLVFAQDKADVQKPKNLEGCIYADVVYQTGEKHRVQQSVTDPITHKMAMVDVEPEIWQECVEDKNVDKTKSPRFYWRILPN